MAAEPNEQRASVEPGEPFVGPRVGRSAAERTRGVRTAEPIREFIARFLGVQVVAPVPRFAANGERATGWWLGRLPAGWHVFNDIPVGEAGTSVDHLVIGPPGVFTINTKTLSGKVWLGPKSVLHNRRRTDFLPRASEDAHRASRLLSAAVGRPVQVRGALAILADDWTIKQRPVDIYVGATRGVKDWMLSQPAILRAHEVRGLAGAASNPHTWLQPRLDPPTP